MKIGFTCGTFDLLHAGHVLMLKECREQCDRLIVGLQIDPSVDRKEKNAPVQTLKERYIQIEGCRYVDEIIIYSTESDLFEYLSVLNRLNTTKAHQGIFMGTWYFRFIGADWKGKPYTGHELSNLPVIFNSRDHGYSSSELRKRIASAEAKSSDSAPVSTVVSK